MYSIILDKTTCIGVDGRHIKSIDRSTLRQPKGPKTRTALRARGLPIKTSLLLVVAFAKTTTTMLFDKTRHHRLSEFQAVVLAGYGSTNR